MAAKSPITVGSGALTLLRASPLLLSTMPKSTGEDWMSVPDACRLLGINNRLLYRLIDEGQVPAYKFGRVIRFRRTDVVELRSCPAQWCKSTPS